MIDTMMALWNQGSQHRGVRVFFSLSLLCMSISLLLVLVIIPGYILFAQSSDEMAVNSFESDSLSPMQQGGGKMLLATPIVFQTPIAHTRGRKCLAHLLRKRSQRRVQVAKNVDPQVRVAIPSSISATLAPLRKSHNTATNRGTNVPIQSHHVFAGRPKGSRSHIQKVEPQSGVLHQKIRPTALPFASVVVPRASATPTGKTHMQLHPHLVLGNVQQREFQANFVHIYRSRAVAQMLKNNCPIMDP